MAERVTDEKVVFGEDVVKAEEFVKEEDRAESPEPAQGNPAFGKALTDYIFKRLQDAVRVGDALASALYDSYSLRGTKYEMGPSLWAGDKKFDSKATAEHRPEVEEEVEEKCEDSEEADSEEKQHEPEEKEFRPVAEVKEDSLELSRFVCGSARKLLGRFKSIEDAQRHDPAGRLLESSSLSLAEKGGDGEDGATEAEFEQYVMMDLDRDTTLGSAPAGHCNEDPTSITTVTTTAPCTTIDTGGGPPPPPTTTAAVIDHRT